MITINKFRIFLFLFIIVGLSTIYNGSLFAQESVYKSILTTGGLGEKKNLAIKLASYKSKSYSYIKLLLDDKNYWNRIAGITAADKSSDSSIDNKILDLYVNDHMTTTYTQNFVQDRMVKLESKFIDLYTNENDSRKKEKLTKLITYPISINIQKILRNDVALGDKNIREFAFAVFTNSQNKIQKINPDDAYIRSFIEDPILKTNVIEYIQLNGSKKDLPIFLNIMNSDKNGFKEKAIALRAIRDWASISEQRSQYEKILSENAPNDSLKYVAMQVLPNIRSEKIRENLCKLSQTNYNQEIRITAAISLIPYDDTKNIPCLEKISIEVITPKPQANLGDAVVVILTFGISGFKSARDENIRRQNFNMNQSKIRDHLNYLKKSLEE